MQDITTTIPWLEVRLGSRCRLDVRYSIFYWNRIFPHIRGMDGVPRAEAACSCTMNQSQPRAGRVAKSVAIY